MPLTIFISHSTNKGPEDPDDLVTSDHRLFLDDLRRRLEEYEDPSGVRPFEVLVDGDLLKVGDPWRKKLVDGLGTCGAGIVLLNKKAITRSDWVLAEANILRWRDWRESRFLLVLVALGEGARAALREETKWQPLAFSEVQFLDGGTEFEGHAIPDAAFVQLTQQLPTGARDAQQAGFEALELAVRLELEEALRGDARQNAATEARRLLESGPVGLHDLVQRWGAYIEPANWLRIVEVIACWWIDPTSACVLATATEGEPSRRSFSLISEQARYTPKLYVRHACFMPPRLAWKVADRITASGGQQSQGAFREGVVDEVRKNLVKLYLNAFEEPDEADDDAIASLIQDNLELSPPRPTFVVLPASVAADVEVKAAILQAFPGLCFLHLARDEATARGIPDCQPLDPLPSLEAEALAYKADRVARSLLSA